MNVSKGTTNLDALIVSVSHALVDDASEYMRSVDTYNIIVSKKLDKKVHRTIQKHSWKNQQNFISLRLRRIVATIMLVCTISFALCMSMQAVREDVWNIILEWYDKFVAVFYVTDDTSPSIIKNYKEPALQLAGSKREIFIKADTIYQLHYTKGEDLIINYQQKIITDSSIDFDSEHDCVQKKVKIHEYKGTAFFYSDGYTIVTWHDKEYVYTIIAYSDIVEIDMLLSIAKSVK